MSLPGVPALASACRRPMRICNRSAGYPFRSAAQNSWSAAPDLVLAPPRVALPAVRNHVSGCSNYTVEQVELSGLEPLTSCMPSVGSTSTRVHPCRSPSSRVPASPPASGCVAVLPCCTAAIPAQEDQSWPRCSPDQRQSCTPGYRCVVRCPSGQAGPCRSAQPLPRFRQRGHEPVAAPGRPSTTGSRKSPGPP
jgi:hypothetical protein